MTDDNKESKDSESKEKPVDDGQPKHPPISMIIQHGESGDSIEYRGSEEKGARE